MEKGVETKDGMLYVNGHRHVGVGSIQFNKHSLITYSFNILLFITYWWSFETKS